MIQLEIITSKGLALNESAYEIIIETAVGQIGILENHANIVGLTVEGVITLRRQQSHGDNQLEYYAVSKNAIVEVGNNKVRILADEAERSEDIDEKETQRAYDAAKKMVADSKDKQSLDQAMASLDRYAVRLKVADLKRHRRR